MYRPFVVLIALILWSSTTLPQALQASAETVLNRAVVQKLSNLVQLMPQNRAAKRARVSDALSPGDALSTGRTSLAELRFNDGSLVRVGEQAIFRFVNKTRNFKLSNGTVLLLIPPGQGKTNVWTPNATAAIRGSALFIRYIPQTATTVVGALTNSNIEVSNQQANQRQVLQAGQMVVLVKDRMEGLYNFDLKTFYETSDLVQGLDLNKKSGATSSDPAIAAVQAETTTAASAQLPLTDVGVIVNPSFVSRPNNAQSQQPTLNLQQDSQNPFNSNSNSAELLENSEIISNPANSPLPTKTETSIGVPPNIGTEQLSGGNNENSSSVTGGGEVNSGNGNPSSVTGGSEINSGNGNPSSVTGGSEINSGNSNPSSVTGGGEVNSGNSNPSSVTGGGEVNSGNGNSNGNGNNGNGNGNNGNNGNNGRGQGVGGGRENNRGNGNDDD